MSIYGLPGSRMYWNSSTRVDCVANTMTMHRWEAIKRNIHFADNTQLIPRGQPGHDQLHKVRPLLTSLLESFQAIPMDERLCDDEQIVPFKGRSGLKQYNPRKPKRWGYKIYVLSDSNGIAYNFQLPVATLFCDLRASSQETNPTSCSLITGLPVWISRPFSKREKSTVLEQ
ncbi:hypothetical protein OYC64_013561 [Pagothenia borchgrevinki]|uniref:PiggyBac transposable element-derived protein domain-containing protein n=1 Tax=Pagothenia borchgrevinki TaxID=8213 RepID=A0ABD2FUH0_PAGBO